MLRIIKVLQITKGDNYNEITEGLKQTNNQCVCVPKYAWTDDTLCVCKAFKEQTTEGHCHCRRYKKVWKTILGEKNEDSN